MLFDVEVAHDFWTLIYHAGKFWDVTENTEAITAIPDHINQLKYLTSSLFSKIYDKYIQDGEPEKVGEGCSWVSNCTRPDKPVTRRLGIGPKLE